MVYNEMKLLQSTNLELFNSLLLWAIQFITIVYMSQLQSTKILINFINIMVGENLIQNWDLKFDLTADDNWSSERFRASYEYNRLTTQMAMFSRRNVFQTLVVMYLRLPISKDKIQEKLSCKKEHNFSIFTIIGSEHRHLKILTIKHDLFD